MDAGHYIENPRKWKEKAIIKENADSAELDRILRELLEEDSE